MPATMENITVSIPKRLVAVVEEIVKENPTTNRSRVISQCLEGLARSRKEELMIKYYETMAREHQEFAKKSVKVIQKIASSWGD